MFEGDEDADLGLFAVEDAAQVADLAVIDVAAFDAEDDLFGFAAGVVMEEEAAVDAFVG